MDGHAGNPFGVCLQFLGHLLLHQIVNADVALRGHKEVGPDGVEGHALNQAFVAPEGVLAPSCTELVDEHLLMAGVIRHDRGQVVPFGVPGQLLDILREATVSKGLHKTPPRFIGSSVALWDAGFSGASPGGAPRLPRRSSSLVPRSPPARPPGKRRADVPRTKAPVAPPATATRSTPGSPCGESERVWASKEPF